MAVSKLVLLLFAMAPVCLGTPTKAISKELYDIILNWAPLVWLHSEEVFFPSSVDFHFENVEVRADDETVAQSSPDRYTVLTGPDTRSMHLNSVPDLSCADCLLDWFAGQNITEMAVPTYVFVKDYQDACGTVDVAYRSFYPYNFGKDVCIGVPIGDVCEGYMQSFGNHVGDWEHFSIRIRNNKVVDCYVSVHSFGAWYTWNDTTNNFQFTHGIHEYAHFPIHLIDKVDRGYAWRTWDNLEVVVYDPDTTYEGALHYLDYRGRWGNKKRGCEVEPVSGECILVGGPGFWQQGPGDFPDDCIGA